MNQPQSVTLAFTGASGMPYGMRLLAALINAGIRVNLVYSKAAQLVAKQEMGMALPARAADLKRQFVDDYGIDPKLLEVYGEQDYLAPIASGSNPSDAMVICPCSMGTLAAVAAGSSDNLIERAADVTLKEQKKLVIVPRETPFSVIHLENMLKLARLNAVILPPSPGFYTHPETIEDMVDFVVARVLDQLRVPHTLMQRWGEDALPELPSAPTADEGEVEGRVEVEERVEVEIDAADACAEESDGTSQPHAMPADMRED